MSTASTIYDRVLLGGRVIDPASSLDAVRNIGVRDGRIAIVTADAIQGRESIDARGLVVAPGFIDIHTHGQTPETYEFYSLDGVTTALELELGTSDVDAWYRDVPRPRAGPHRRIAAFDAMQRFACDVEAIDEHTVSAEIS